MKIQIKPANSASVFHSCWISTGQIFFTCIHACD